jgi:hypothetical protein
MKKLKLTNKPTNRSIPTATRIAPILITVAPTERLIAGEGDTLDFGGSYGFSRISDSSIAPHFVA